MARKRLVVIDGKAVFYRGYYAMPNLSLKDGTPTGGVYGFAVMALEVLKKMKPDYVCVAWDKAKTNIRRRREIYPEYKANRKPAPPDFYAQVPILMDLLKAFGWPLYEIDDHEADDIMGTFAVQAHKKGYETILVSGDHDLLQTVAPDTTVAILRKGLTNVELFTPEHFVETYEMTPQQFIDYKSLRGDASDNLPGVGGVGDKTAKKLILDYASLDGVYENIELVKGSLKGKLEKDKDMAYLTQQLVALDTNVDLVLDWDAADVHKAQPQAIAQKLHELEFRTLLRQLPKDMQLDESDIKTSTNAGGIDKVDIALLTTPDALAKASFKTGQYFAIHAISTGVHGRGLKALMLSDHPKKAYLVQLGGELSEAALAEWLKGLDLDKAAVVGYDVKLAFKALLQLGLPIPSVSHDVRIGAFLLNGLIREPSLSDLAREHLGYEGSSLDEFPPEEFASKASLIAGTIWSLHRQQLAALKEMPKVAKLAHNVEWPVIPVLARMEVEGIRLETSYLDKMARRFADKISDLEQSIYGYADQEFNISSPSQLAEILFEKLQLPTKSIKKGKTGYSTAASELDKLRDLHPVINLISQYREVTKLKNTYVDPLPKLVDEEGKLHTTFDLDVAPTGRLSSRDPNLMNIPVRTEMGKEIRNAFVPSKGNVFISADYSQFELRLAGALSGDKDIIKMFDDPHTDIHTQTAAEMYDKDPRDVTTEERHSAKAVNFGVMYGLGTHGLSAGSGMSFKEASEFIERYFEIRKGLKYYIENLKTQARDEGYVETLFGRRRPTPDVKSSNFMVREAAKRAAINMPIQGTEADLMKMAMVEVDKRLPDNCKQLLQIHDSILVECPKDDAEKIAKLLKRTMENIYSLPVKLEVDTKIGNNWGEL